MKKKKLVAAIIILSIAGVFQIVAGIGLTWNETQIGFDQSSIADAMLFILRISWYGFVIFTGFLCFVHWIPKAIEKWGKSAVIN